MKTIEPGYENIVRVCRECHELIEKTGSPYSDDVLDYCPNCQRVEGNYDKLPYYAARIPFNEYPPERSRETMLVDYGYIRDYWGLRGVVEYFNTLSESEMALWVSVPDRTDDGSPAGRST